jgi:hypothetical protein
LSSGLHLISTVTLVTDVRSAEFTVAIADARLPIP